MHTKTLRALKGGAHLQVSMQTISQLKVSNSHWGLWQEIMEQERRVGAKRASQTGQTQSQMAAGSRLLPALRNPEISSSCARITCAGQEVNGLTNSQADG